MSEERAMRPNNAYDLWRGLHFYGPRRVGGGNVSSDPGGTPKEVHITIEQKGWNLTNVETGRIYNVYPAAHEGMCDGDLSGRWAVGPIEIARILERLGIRVKVTVERSV